MQSSNSQLGRENKLIPCPEIGYASSAESSSNFAPISESETLPQALDFNNQFKGKMVLHADTLTVMNYLDSHQGWFCRCAHPIAVEPVESNGYVLSLGRYGSFGFEVEPQIGLQLLPQEEGIYRITTIPTHNQYDHCYQVDFQASLQLVDDATEEKATPSHATVKTTVEWDLALKVSIVFPQFILRLPQKVIRAAGDTLLQQIVRQISQRLTQKVQDDFHATHNICCP